MTNLTVKGTHSYFLKTEDRPTGAILCFGEIRDRQCDTNDIRIHTVNQNGRVATYRPLEIFHYSQIIFQNFGGGETNSSVYIPAMKISSNGEERFATLYLEQEGISTGRDPLKTTTEFQAFFDLGLALKYSNYLKSNDEYVASVTKYHKKLEFEYDHSGLDYS